MVWSNVVEFVADTFPLHSATEAKDAPPSISLPIDTGCSAALADLSGPNLRPELNPLDIEDLLDTVVSRLSNCMTIREKAQELEMRALSAALDYTTQMEWLTAAEEIEKASAPVTSQLLSSFRTVELKNNIHAGKDQAPAQYWQEQLQRRLAQLSASKRSAEAFRAKSAEPGNGSNYVERFEFLRKLFFQNLREAYARARAAEIGLEEVYRISERVPQVTDVGYLNALVLWAQMASDNLDKALGGRHFGTLALAVAAKDEAPTDLEILKRAGEFNPKLAAQTVDFNLTSKPFDWSGMKNPRMRGFDMRLIKGNEQLPKYWAAHVDLPDQSLRGGSVLVRSHVNLPATLADSDFHRPPRGMRSVHNANPIGRWVIRLPSRALTGEVTNTTEITNILLFLRVSYEPL